MHVDGGLQTSALIVCSKQNNYQLIIDLFNQIKLSGFVKCWSDIYVTEHVSPLALALNNGTKGKNLCIHTLSFGWGQSLGFTGVAA